MTEKKLQYVHYVSFTMKQKATSRISQVNNIRVGNFMLRSKVR